jgi:hypothetical protein
MFDHRARDGVWLTEVMQPQIDAAGRRLDTGFLIGCQFHDVEGDVSILVGTDAPRYRLNLYIGCQSDISGVLQGRVG